MELKHDLHISKEVMNADMSLKTKLLYAVIDAIGGREGEVFFNAKEIADVIDTNPQYVEKKLSELKEKGLVEFYEATPKIVFERMNRAKSPVGCIFCGYVGIDGVSVKVENFRGIGEIRSCLNHIEEFDFYLKSLVVRIVK